jgi:tetratricopeptide (TPR) repeat protein
VSDLGRALADRGLHEEAAAMYGRAIRLRPADATAHLGRGDMLAVMGKWSEAEAAFSEVIRLAPSLVSAAFARAHARARVGRGAEAEADYAAALRLAPDWPEQTARSAWQTATGSDAKSRPKALVVLQAERASDARGGRSADALDALAAAYADAGRWADAVATAEKAVAAATAGNRLDLAAQIRKRRDLYADRKPFRSKSGGG